MVIFLFYQISKTVHTYIYGRIDIEKCINIGDQSLIDDPVVATRIYNYINNGGS